MNLAVCTSRSVDNQTDEGLVTRVKAGDEEAFSLLLARYANRLRFQAQQYFLPGSDLDDLLQIAHVGLWQAALQYEPQSPIPFRAWVQIVVRRRLNDAIKYAQRFKRRTLDTAISMAKPLSQEDSVPHTLADRLIASESTPEEQVVQKALIHDLVTVLSVQLSDLEWRVFCDLLVTHSLIQTATRLEISYKRVDNALQRIRRKASAFMSTIDGIL